MRRFAVDGGKVNLLLIELLGLDVAEAATRLGARKPSELLDEPLLFVFVDEVPDVNEPLRMRGRAEKVWLLHFRSP